MQALRSYLAEHGSHRLFRKNASLYFQSEKPKEAALILDGIVKAYTISPDGVESIVYLFGKGSVIPTAWINDLSSVTLFNYDALNDVRAITFSKDVFESALEDSERLGEYNKYMQRAHASLLIRTTGLTQTRAISKICYTLYYLMFRYGIERDGGLYEIDMRITHNLLANLIGQTRESTAKNIKLLKKAGVVMYKESRYFIHKQKLEDYMGEDSFRGLNPGREVSATN